MTTRLRAALTEAMSSPDVTATAAIRSALGAIGNAEAVAVPADAAEIAERQAAAAQFDTLGQAGDADRLRREALVLVRILGSR